MKNRTLLLPLTACLSLLGTGEAPASTKPCRDREGKVVQCPKPPRKMPERCKDEKGRFSACTKPGAAKSSGTA